MHVTQCLVRDGLGWSEQGLINEEGCPQVDSLTILCITRIFPYNTSLTMAVIRITRLWAS